MRSSIVQQFLDGFVELFSSLRLAILLMITLVILATLVIGLWASGALAYQEILVRDGGTIAGKVSFNGKIPEPQHFLVQKNPDVCGKERDFAFVRVSNGALQNVVVVLQGVERGKPFAAPPTQFEWKDCVSLPYVATAPKKSAEEWPVFKIENKDTVVHNPHTFELLGAGRRTLWNIALPEQGSKLEKEVRVRKGNVIKLECDQHDFMHSWIRVVENPYFAIVAGDGHFEIGDVSPGTYKVVAWHPILGEQTQEVNVGVRGRTKADFTFTGK